MARIKCGQLPSKENAEARAPIHLCAVIDRSGSMEGPKLDLVKKSMEFVVKQLHEDDMFSVVSFDDRITVEHPLSAMTGDGKRAALRAVQELTSRGSTNLSGGLFAGFNEIAGADIVSGPVTSGSTPSGVVSSCWLFTDGLANAGIQDAPTLVLKTQEILGRLPSCTVYTFGFGEDHNGSMLREIAAAGGGVYYYVQDATLIAKSFADCLGGLVSVGAQNLRLKITCPAGVGLQKLHTTFPHEHTGNTATVRIRDLYEDEEKDTIVTLEIGQIPEQQDAWRCVTWELTYTDVVSGADIVIEAEQFLERLEVAAPDQTPPSELDQQRNRIVSMNALTKARELGDANDLNGARSVLNEAIAFIKASRTGEDSVSVGLIKTLEDSLTKMVNKVEYEKKGKWAMEDYYSSHCGQRGTCQTEGMYVNKSKCAMKSKWADESEMDEATDSLF
jgi:Mg-chelatase subunit ChlD